MRTLLLMRHAKATHCPGYSDRQRPLKKSGRAAAASIAETLRKDGLRPDLILCSPSRRTRETAELVAEAFPTLPDQILIDDLYLASASEILSCIRTVPKEIGTLMLVGHNIGLEHLTQILAGPVGKAWHLSPGTLAIFTLDAGDWAQTDASCMSDPRLVRPD